MSKKFTRRREDFTCIKCNTKVAGDGYTNHCPNCLWSLHVDLNPGDRANPCQGLMEPVGIKQGAKLKVIHKCLKCNEIKQNKLHDADNFDAALNIIKRC